MKKQFTITAILIVIITLSACNGFQKLLKSNDYELKYQKANAYFNEGDFDKALLLYEQLLPIFKGMEKGEEVYYKYAQCHYETRDYILAGYYFRRFANTFQNSKFTEEAMFLSSYCYYLDSPKPSLDQETTNQAILEFELFLTRYPQSTRKDTCNILMDDLRKKLQQKSYNNAMLYSDLEYYKAAVVTLKNSLTDFPDSPYKEEILFTIVKNSYIYANNSIENKKAERMQNTIKEYNTFVKNYEQSKYQRDANRYYEKAMEYVNTVKN